MLVATVIVYLMLVACFHVGDSGQVLQEADPGRLGSVTATTAHQPGWGCPAWPAGTIRQQYLSAGVLHLLVPTAECRSDARGTSHQHGVLIGTISPSRSVRAP